MGGVAAPGMDEVRGGVLLSHTLIGYSNPHADGPNTLIFALPTVTGRADPRGTQMAGLLLIEYDGCPVYRPLLGRPEHGEAGAEGHRLGKLLSPEPRRCAVNHARQAHGLSKRLACRVVKQSRGT